MATPPSPSCSPSSGVLSIMQRLIYSSISSGYISLLDGVSNHIARELSHTTGHCLRYSNARSKCASS